MANVYRGQATLAVGEKTFTLVFDCNAICILEQELKMSMGEFIQKAQARTLDYTGTRALLFAGMQAKHESTTLKKCGDIIDIVTIAFVMNTCWEALRHCFPEVLVSQGNEPAAVGTGEPSLPSPVKPDSVPISSGG